jgi:phosphodiesterase family protein
MTVFNVISDTHRKSADEIKKLIPVFNEGDFIVHLGDGISDLEQFEDEIKRPVLKVCGNCDLFSSVPKNIFTDSDAGKLLFTHGDTHYVKGGNLTGLYLFAKQNDCVCAFYGHTHKADIKLFRDVLLINPGSLSCPRVGLPSYCKVTVEKGRLIPKIVLI